MRKKINKKNTVYILLTVLVTCTISSISHAQEDSSKVESDPNKGLPSRGVLSSTYTAGDQTRSVDVWGKNGSAVDAQAPISGSVSRLSEKQWQMKVYNNTEDSFNTDVRVKQINSKGSVIKSDSFSLRLKPKESADRLISGLSGAADAQLELLSWKRIASAKPTITEATIAPPQKISVAPTPGLGTVEIVPANSSDVQKDIKRKK